MLQEWQQFLSQYPLISSSTQADAIMDLSYLGYLKISGPDAKKFLQGQLTCHLDEVTDAEFRLGAHCNPKGRIISLFRLFIYQGNYYLQMPREMVSLALNALKKYAVFFNVQLTDASHEWISIGYIGSGLSTFIPFLPQRQYEMVQCNDILLFNMSNTIPRYQLLGNIVNISDLFKKLISHATFLSRDHWQYHDLESKIPQIYPETSEKFLPHEINLHLHNGISFNKGCYTGQEIIARMHYRGQLKTQLVFSIIESLVTPERGHDLPGTHNTVVDLCKKDHNVYALLIL